ncbi:MAG: hypothetical protein HY308_18430 [Gammaproteobacteria bacterium]|nr:hypothetical protein [Gammaproteobacteria bacterium]
MTTPRTTRITVPITRYHCSIDKRQRGVALAMALILLLVLTVLGISAMGTSSVQAVMARSIQDTQRAFEAAESGLNKAINTAGSFDLYQAVNNNFTFGSGGAQTSAAVTTEFLSFAAPTRGSGYSAVNFDSANFDQSSVGAVSTTSAKTTLHQGVSQIVNKSE